MVFYQGIVINCLKQSAITVGRKLDLKLTFHNYLALKVHCWQSRLLEKHDTVRMSTEELISLKESYCFIVINARCHDQKFAFLGLSERLVAQLKFGRAFIFCMG